MSGGGALRRVNTSLFRGVAQRNCSGGDAVVTAVHAGDECTQGGMWLLSFLTGVRVCGERGSDSSSSPGGWRHFAPKEEEET